MAVGYVTCYTRVIIDCMVYKWKSMVMYVTMPMGHRTTARHTGMEMSVDLSRCGHQAEVALPRVPHQGVYGTLVYYF